MSVTKIWSNAFQLDYLPFLLSITFERCFILPLYAFLWEGQNDPICDGSNFLFMYKKKWDPPFLISFYLHNTFFGVKVFQIHQNAENFNKKKSSEQKSIQTHFKTSKSFTWFKMHFEIISLLASNKILFYYSYW